VIGAGGGLTGYGWGLDRKRFLLDLEAGVAPSGATGPGRALSSPSSPGG
jgi:methylated-DNA-[protein]-cysteine S-methyltransferase